ncbi:rhodanese-like domain-containing protein [Rudanella paleaurantiibacter]|uniref:Rhodanese-like domain-containing protein n=1 Tax=Rudanella paleaurantiibacter TaxID=2614655 RepID=A0A7J5U046_9BACT|nr:rhodanese-like domain-containing protein [Rudanella paleaurantiibacter]KAB7729990.1 rhodanese-like domain-containing protein [Rudanella paleaurantiibacter]
MRVFLILLVLWLPGCSSGTKQTAVIDMTAAEFKAALDSTAARQLIDVRTGPEVSGGVIPGAQQIDISSDYFEQQLDGLDKATPVYVYCAVGSRSAQAARLLAQKGFGVVYNLTGGIDAWIGAGYPVVPLR